MAYLDLEGNYVKEKDVYNASESLTTRLSNIEARISALESATQPYMISGTTVKTASGNYVAVHKWSEIQSFFETAYGFTPSDATLLGVSYVNGDGSAVSTHVEGATFQSSTFYAVFSSSVSGSIRINFAYFYNQ